MGAITPIASGLGQIAGTLGTINQVVSTVQTLSGNGQSENSDELALRQLQERQRLQARQLAQDTALEREKIALQSAQDEQDRQRALRRAVARQRANFGSQGLSSGGGSAQAVLLGLFDESDEELASREALDNLRSRALDLEQSQARSLNVLQRTQLQERQKLNNNISGFGDLF